MSIRRAIENPSMSAKDLQELQNNQSPSLTPTPVASTVAPIQPSSFEVKTSTVTSPTAQESEELFGPPKTTAQEILRREGIKSAKDVLNKSPFAKSEDPLKPGGVTTAKSIIAREKERQEGRKFSEEQKLKQMQQSAEDKKIEDDLKKQEDEYRKNLDPSKIDSSYEPIYNTKFGELNFKNFEFKNDTFFGGDTIVKDTVENKTYIFVPEEYVYKGINRISTGYPKGYTSVNTAFLDDKHWDIFLEKAQYIDLSETAIDTAKLLPHYGQEDAARGFLVAYEDITTLFPFDKLRSFNVSDTDAWGGSILGLSSYGGQLVYAQENRSNSHTSYLKADGQRWRHWQTKKKGPLEFIPIIGKPLTDIATSIAQGFAQIPFGAEIAFALSGGTNPYLYASLKALETAGKGGTLTDVIKSGAVAYATASVPMQKVTGNVANYFVKEGIITNVVAAKAVAGSLVGATFQGTLAAAQGQDVGAAMKAGAISGGINATAAEITANIFGGTEGAKVGAERIQKLATSVKMTASQFSNIFAGSLSSGAIASAVQGKDFFDAFAESLVARGVSISASNQIRDSLKNDTKMSAESISIIQNNTRNVIDAMARSAIRGESYEVALQKIIFASAKGGAEYGGSILGKTIGELTSGVKKT